MPFPEKWNMSRFPKDVEMRSPSSDDDVFTEPPASKQDKEKKRKKTSSSPDPEKDKPKRRLGKELPSWRGGEADPQQFRETDAAGVEASQAAGNASKEELGVIEIAKSPSFMKSMFIEAQTAKECLAEGLMERMTLSVASIFHHEAFLSYRDDLKQLEAEVRELTEKRDASNLLNEQLEGEAKNLRAELEVARKDHADLVELVKVFEVSDDEFYSVTDGQNPQLRAAKERVEVQTKKVEELQSRPGSAFLDRDNFAKEIKMTKSEVAMVKAEADEMVAQYKADAEADQDQSKNIAEHMKWQSRRQALEEIHARGFDLSAEIENAKVFEAETRKLAFPKEEDSEDSSRPKVEKTPGIPVMRRAPAKIKPLKCLSLILSFFFLYLVLSVEAVLPL
uniref:Uncharacterized protein n=1 Tax=Nicotiana tabacum TaxID=4097 RepID=A0A1S4D2K6_TOBAC|nr:PREDICTED: uncharacterized protein LOC107825329 [Nicotiana tabacum]